MAGVACGAIVLLRRRWRRSAASAAEEGAAPEDDAPPGQAFDFLAGLAGDALAACCERSTRRRRPSCWRACRPPWQVQPSRRWAPKSK